MPDSVGQDAKHFGCTWAAEGESFTASLLRGGGSTAVAAVNFAKTPATLVLPLSSVLKPWQEPLSLNKLVIWEKLEQCP